MSLLFEYFDSNKDLKFSRIRNETRNYEYTVYSYTCPPGVTAKARITWLSTFQEEAKNGTPQRLPVPATVTELIRGFLSTCDTVAALGEQNACFATAKQMSSKYNNKKEISWSCSRVPCVKD
jgi:hypothetical protein